MNELVAFVIQKTNLTTEQATAVITIVISYLKSRLPSPVAGQIDILLGGGVFGKP
jgi:hypothetical protein